MTHVLQQHLSKRSESGKRTGIYSVCSAHPWVLRAAGEQARVDGSLLLIEATSNQVNQAGGYTGMRPSEFRRFAERIVNSTGFDCAGLVLGGDHLGPNPWRNLAPEAAMTHSLKMVAEYAAAGFSKIHLDASMPCGNEVKVLTDETIAARAAQLCATAEAAAETAGLPEPVYVIGTEVPTPGGATHDLDELAATTTTAAQNTLDVHHAAFMKAGLHDAWERVMALVVQPGIEFDHDSVVDYAPLKAAALARWLREQTPKLVFEAHSTDYQKPETYAQLVQDGFAILKVGPALTFAMREALFALAAIEKELFGEAESSHLPSIVEQKMLAEPVSWRPYYSGNEQRQRLLRVYSYSDRMRYYWNDAAVEAAVLRLVTNLTRTAIPETTLSAYLPQQYQRVREGILKNDAESLIVDKVRDVLRVYAAAC
ncbi:D-tagatose-bisphosphate aldolase, class II, non-catalytic subunit [Granulicella sp. S190]|uniref:D-tagatose-bisphosphate aldolase, class II, non-catalytic subunit n=1 Tax=Granulicella sp. S190 TaxID=1747226 RepID=UPI00131B9B93|nr:D-tagatose-bisphosphate aldolase, class II, non-catalytic subunit [Granulicella sp. S190]